MSDIPAELKYAATHEWARLEEDGTVTVGISDHAQSALGDVVYIEGPEIGLTVGAQEEAGGSNPSRLRRTSIRQWAEPFAQ